ncbi:HpsJ family protein [Ruficoccus sp. ZRK36]|uniref:HpsJ-like protein, cyanoexosortase A-associated n=1 Tax=Ruficoccus sp. ZRK36 TaxID=2866311 RepID=UPI001C732E79|nr:HpsJ family protein [Ruficoccus sp. ZRK36]QYY36952.1 HpsJ family protein [Ruficoccus sp. ZRK36]
MTSRSFLRVVGWALLLLGFIDAVYILIGTDWLNSISELRTGGRLAEHALAPILGMLLLLLPAGDKFTPKEVRTLSRTSKLSLVLAVFSLALVPFILVSAIRIQRAYDRQVTAWVDQQKERTEAAIKQLNDKRTKEDVQAFVQPLPLDEKIFFEPDVEVLKTNISERFHELNDGNIEQAEARLSARLRSVWTDSIKWSLAALINTAVFALLWHRSRRYGRLASSAKGKK